MPLPIILGNDVVDLSNPRCSGKASDRRFLRRVFTHSEATAIVKSPTPDRALWQRWAAKEAAFKVVSRLHATPPPFQHSRFQVRLEAAPWPVASPPPPLRGQVSYRGTHVMTVCHQDADWVHAVAWHAGVYQEGVEAPGILADLSTLADADPSGETEWESRLKPRFSSREWACVYSRPSAVTRLLARASVARTLGIEEARLEIVCGPGYPGRRPPHLLVDGEESSIPISLSHHGKLAAWAVAEAPAST